MHKRPEGNWTARKPARDAYLNCSTVSLKSDDLSNQVVSTNSDQLVHSRSSHVVSNDDRPGDFAYIPAGKSRRGPSLGLMHASTRYLVVRSSASPSGLQHESQHKLLPVSPGFLLGSLRVPRHLARLSQIANSRCSVNALWNLSLGLVQLKLADTLQIALATRIDAAPCDDHKRKGTRCRSVQRPRWKGEK